jgi:hypothetical protein
MLVYTHILHVHTYIHIIHIHTTYTTHTCIHTCHVYMCIYRLSHRLKLFETWRIVHKIIGHVVQKRSGLILMFTFGYKIQHTRRNRNAHL